MGYIHVHGEAMCMCKSKKGFHASQQKGKVFTVPTMKNGGALRTVQGKNNGGGRCSNARVWKACNWEWPGTGGQAGGKGTGRKGAKGSLGNCSGKVE